MSPRQPDSGDQRDDFPEWEAEQPGDFPPAPDPFGTRAGRRSLGVRRFMAVWLFLMGTTLLVLGGILFARAGNMLGVLLLVALELAFTFGFILLMREAGKR